MKDAFPSQKWCDDFMDALMQHQGMTRYEAGKALFDLLSFFNQPQVSQRDNGDGTYTHVYTFEIGQDEEASTL